MWFRHAFLALLLGFVASFWITVPTSAAHAGPAATQSTQATAEVAAICAAGSLIAAVEAGGKPAGETDEIGYGPLPEGDGPSRTAAAPDDTGWPCRDVALPVPLRPPALA